MAGIGTTRKTNVDAAPTATAIGGYNCRGIEGSRHSPPRELRDAAAERPILFLDFDEVDEHVLASLLRVLRRVVHDACKQRLVLIDDAGVTGSARGCPSTDAKVTAPSSCSVITRKRSSCVTPNVSPSACWTPLEIASRCAALWLAAWLCGPMAWGNSVCAYYRSRILGTANHGSQTTMSF